MAANAPKVDLGAIAAGAELKHVQGTKVSGQDAALAHASAMNSINRQGEIAMPSERLVEVEKGQNAALARAGLLTTIAKQGVKEANPEAVAKVEAARVAKLAELNAGKTTHINVKPGEAKEEDLAAAKAAAGPLIAAIGKEKPVLKRATPKESNEALQRANLLNTISKQGIKSAKPVEEKGLSKAVARGAILNSINKQGIIATPADSAAELEAAYKAKVTELNKDKKVFYVIKDGESKADDVKPEVALPLADITAAAKKADLKHVEPVQKNEALGRAGLLREVSGKAPALSKVAAVEPKGEKDAVARGQMLNSINRQGVIATPEDSAAEVEAARAKKIAELEAAAKAEAAK